MVLEKLLTGNMIVKEPPALLAVLLILHVYLKE
jgi:hypothetical protein